jgi:hypothetical protein
MSKIKVVSKLKEVNFLKGLERLNTFFGLLDKHYPVFKQNDLEEKRAEAKKALDLLEEILDPLNEIRIKLDLHYFGCNAQAIPKSQATRELLINICNRMGKDKCHPNTAQMQSHAAPGPDKSETGKH